MYKIDDLIIEVKGSSKMGMYTRLNININLKPNSDLELALTAMQAPKHIDIDIKHPLFDSPRWRMIFGGSSYSFDGCSCSRAIYDDVDDEIHLTINSSIKNYNDEYQKFLDFISPHIVYDDYYENGMFVGYIQYEDDENPTLLYATKNGIEYRQAV